MLRQCKRDNAMAVGSSALAGYVDVIGFLCLGDGDGEHGV